MRAFYVDLVRGAWLDFIAGPFGSEEIARKYQQAAVGKQVELDPWAPFDDFGVSAVSGGFCQPGRLNDQIEIDPGDLLN
ncbi:hypothetical protein [Novosphingobium sp. Gsoil 351]|uniref:hypothetical protein n=1 Tax=Novosphingobium sp. Gsoil 351 TaxID=2675225 RepID=UPI0012B47DD3|nr:hypothetical protein [Novosphingobium sp. Gsoil 351]QGN55507.1 hypothetical protein GKE62_14035 [Novosphingobium sp. Gsoil 351]